MALPNPIPPNPGETIESAWGRSMNERAVFRYTTELDVPGGQEAGDTYVVEGFSISSGNPGKLYVFDGTARQEYVHWGEFGPIRSAVADKVIPEPGLEQVNLGPGDWQNWGSGFADFRYVLDPITGIVQLQGMIRNGTTQIIGSLPPPRDDRTHVWWIPTVTTGTFNRIDLLGDGTLQWNSTIGTQATFDGMQYPTAIPT